MTSFVNIPFQILHEVLRLPKDVRIVGVEPGDQPGFGKLLLTGALPDGEVTAHYKYVHTTVIEFQGWEKLVAELPPKALS